MSAVLPDPLAASYRDPKKPLWLLPALIPAIVATGPVAHLTGHDHAAWYILPGYIHPATFGFRASRYRANPFRTA